MQIAHLETGRHLYGGARQVVLLLNGLAEQGVRSTLVCPTDSAIATAVNHPNIQVDAMPMAGDLDVRFGRRFGRWLSKNSPDLLHVHSRRGADIWGGIAARRASIPALVTRRVDNPEPPVVGRLKYRMFDHVIAISDQIRKQVHADGVAREKISLVYSAVDPLQCQPTWSRGQFLEAFGLSVQNVTVICAAQLIPRKGHRNLLEAWSLLSAKHPQARLLLFGRGPLQTKLTAEITRLGLQESVQMPCFRADLREFLGCADMLVHPATSEGLGVILLEAQAAGLPIVTIGGGGSQEAVAPNESALLVAPEDPAALAAAIARLLDDLQLRKSLGEAGRKHVAERFTVEQMVSGNMRIYEMLLNK